MILRRRRRGRPGASLTKCHSCAADCVVPTDWTAEKDDGWWIRLRCGECGASRDVVVSDAAAQHYDLELDCGMREIARTLHRLDHERMTAEAERFAAALRLDLVDAGDFAR